MARRHRGAEVHHLCAICVLGDDDAKAYLATGRLAYYEQGQVQTTAESPDRQLLCLPARVQYIDVASQLIEQLARDPDLLLKIGPEAFEALVFDRLSAMGLEVQRVGAGTFTRDGGVDAVAWPKFTPYPFLLAIQAKHTSFQARRVGPAPVRDLFGVIQAHGFNAGLLVTNTTFTPDARWFARQAPVLLQLRDNEDLQRWLRNEFLPEFEWRNMPRSIELCPGISVPLRR